MKAKPGPGGRNSGDGGKGQRTELTFLSDVSLDDIRGLEK